MNDLLSLNWVDIAAKLSPTGMLLMLFYFFMRWLGNQLFRRAHQREQAIDAGSDKLITGTLSWAEDMQAWAKGVQAHLAECLEHHAACTEELSRTRQEVSELRTQVNMPGLARQMAQQAIAANRAAEGG